MRRETVEVKSGKRRIETAYGVTSLDRKAATPQRLLTLNRGHWTIEATHHILDWSFDEESQPHPHRARSREHDPAPALRHRTHPGARVRRRRDHAESGQEPAPGPRLPEDDRERQPAGSARPDRSPASRLRRLTPNPRQAGAPSHARMPE